MARLLHIMHLTRKTERAPARLVLGRGCALVLSLALFAASAQAAVRVSAALDRNTTAVGESVMLSLVFEGGAPTAPFSLPEIPGLEIEYRGQFSQFSSVNGQTSSTLTHRFLITPQKASEFTIPSYSILVAGQTLMTQPLRLKVQTSAEAGRTAIGNQGSQAFIRINVPRTNLFVGEIVPVDIQLFVARGSRSQPPQLQTNGFNVGRMARFAPAQTQLGSQIYDVLVYRLPITPAETGSLVLGPARCTIAVPSSGSGRPRSLPFSRLFDESDWPSFFDESDLRSATIASEPMGIHVSLLPTNDVPAEFTGAVGRFTMSVSASPTNVSVGDPITVRVRISGQGQLDSLSLPQAAAWNDFKLYPPSSKIEITDPLGLEGIKTFEQVVTPQKADIKELPTITFCYFDPDKKRYELLRQAPIPVTVSPVSPVTVAAQLVTPSGRNQPSSELAHIKNRLGHTRQGFTPLLMQTWFMGLQCVPLLAWLAALAYRTSRDRWLADPRLRRRRDAERTVRAGLKQLRQSAATSQAETFFAALFRVLQEQIGVCLDLPASAITEAVVEDHLRPAGFGEDVLREVHELFQMCDQARYAPSHTALELTATLTKLEAVLAALKKAEAKPSLVSL
jgi:hypothetical protein